VGCRRGTPSGVPAWSGAAARLAEAVTVLSVLLTVGRLTSAAGVLRGQIVCALMVLAGGGLARLARSGRLDRGAALAPPPPSTRRVRQPPLPLDGVLAGGVTGLVGIQWLAKIDQAGAGGMAHVDSLWYHLPFAARFVQTGSLASLDGVGPEPTRWFPLDPSLLHALAIVPYGRDWLTPFVNAIWLALAFLAAWCPAGGSAPGISAWPASPSWPVSPPRRAPSRGRASRTPPRSRCCSWRWRSSSTPAATPSHSDWPAWRPGWQFRPS